MKSSNIKPCACGGRSFTRKSPLKGKWVDSIVIFDNGDVEKESTTDEVDVQTIMTYTCDNCGKKFKFDEGA